MNGYMTQSFMDPIAKMWSNTPPAYAGGVSPKKDLTKTGSRDIFIESRKVARRRKGKEAF
jgi:hypothetical protein